MHLRREDIEEHLLYPYTIVSLQPVSYKYPLLCGLNLSQCLFIWLYSKVATSLANAGFTHITPRPSRLNDGLSIPGRVVALSDQPFSLSMPGSTLLPTVTLLKSYMQISPRIPELVSFLWLWVRSHNLHHQFSPHILSLLVISILQVGIIETPTFC